MSWLYEARKLAGLTQCQVADKSKISLSFYNQIEKGNRKPSVFTAKKIADVLNVSWIEFFKEKEG